MQIVDNNNKPTRVRTNTLRLFDYLKTPLLGASIVGLLDIILLQLVLRSVTANALSLLLFFEGGAGLVVGTVIALSSTPSISKVGETFFGSAQWSREAEKNAEKVAAKWIIASTFLIAIGFALGAI